MKLNHPALSSPPKKQPGSLLPKATRLQPQAAAATAVMGKRSYESDYESVRDAHISENKARMEMLGLSRTKEELNMMTPPPARRPYAYKQYATGPPRRSPRLNGLAVQHKALPLRGHLGKATPMLVDYDSDAPAVVGGEMPPAPQDGGGEAMGAVDEPVHGEAAISVGEILLSG